ncbi:MAG TPA: hypothetical protein VM432_04125 [Bdellovibrionales bacterium]|nr:hypothetical protein [Bdellovibrionales bacterium]
MTSALNEKTLRFNLHGSICEINCIGQSDDVFRVAREIEADFSALKTHSLEKPDVSIRLVDDLSISSSAFKFRTTLGQLYLNGKSRQIQFDDGSRARIEFSDAARRADFKLGSSATDFIENFMLASWGEILEKRGFFRLHAAAIAGEEGAQLFVAYSGAGKSTLISRAIESGIKIYTDEMALIFDGSIYACPVPLALDGQNKSSLNKSRSRSYLGSSKPLFPLTESMLAGPAKVQSIVFVSNSISFARPIEWIVSVTLGLGLPQMKEYLVRFDNFGWLMSAAVRRFAFAFTCLIERRVMFQSENEFRTRPVNSPISSRIC